MPAEWFLSINFAASGLTAIILSQNSSIDLAKK